MKLFQGVSPGSSPGSNARQWNWTEFLPGYFEFLPTMLTFNKTNNQLMSQSGIVTESLELQSFTRCILYCTVDRPKLLLNQLSTKTSCVFQEMWALFSPVICGRPKCTAWVVGDGTRLSSPQMHLTVFVWFVFVCLSARYHEMNMKRSLRDNLSYKTLIEYPVLHVVLRDHWGDYPLKEPGTEPQANKHTLGSFSLKLMQFYI